MDDPVRTEWSSEGYLPMAKMNEARAVKLQVESVIGLDGSIQWTVKGTRRVGENTKIGLGMGISANNVAMTVHWKRLGQNINLPVILMPHRHHDAAVLATAIPWVAYCAIEFGYIRPRDRRKRRQEVARRHKELNKLIPKKRAESNQAIELMRDHVARRQAREKHHDGLVVTKAEYGYYPSQSKKPKSGFTEPRVMDATIPVASLVYGGQLVIPKERVKVRQFSSKQNEV
jgi:DnaJ family protein C protein 11